MTALRDKTRLRDFMKGYCTHFTLMCLLNVFYLCLFQWINTITNQMFFWLFTIKVMFLLFHMFVFFTFVCCLEAIGSPHYSSTYNVGDKQVLSQSDCQTP